MSDKKQQIQWIDSFKGIAMIGVFLVHCGDLAFPQISFISQYGNRGVELFFILTGFLTCFNPPNIYNRKDFFRWILKKYIRIMPLAIIAYIVGYSFNYINNAGDMFMNLRWNYKNNPAQTNIFSVIISLTPICFLFTQNINSYVGDYFLVNILYALFYKRINSKQRIICVCLICMSLMLLIPEIVIGLCQYFDLEESKWLHYFEVKIRGIYCFSIGMVIFAFKPTLENIKNRCCNIIGVANCGSFFACVALLYGFYKYNNWNTVYIMLLVTIIIFCQILHENIIIVNKLWSKIGKYSYAFYYVHIPLTMFLCDVYDKRFAVILGLLLSIVLSGFITNYIEKPIIAFGNKFFLR